MPRVPENREKFTFTLGFDPAGRAPENVAKKLYNVSGIPTTYVIDREGKIAASILGYNPESTQLEDALRKLGIRVDLPKGE